MKRIINTTFLIAILVVITGCNNKKEKMDDGMISVVVMEVEHVGSYTYMLVKEKGPEYWIAVRPIDAEPGDIYKYKDGLVMEGFYSAQMDKTFDKVIFIDEIFDGNEISRNSVQELTPGSAVKSEKSGISVDRKEGTTTIAELYADPESYEGKTVLVTGQVIRFNEAIMDLNWVHLQDGTEYEEKFDLTVTTQEKFVVGSVVTVEGVISLNRDFGYGYSYEMMLEKATAAGE
jgi:hypothetical protein